MKLSYKHIPGLTPLQERVLFFDPSEIFTRIKHKIDPYKRHHTGRDFNTSDCFPAKKDGVCDCGCGKPLTGRQRRWATKACSGFAVTVMEILRGKIDTIRRYISLYYFGPDSDIGCCACGITERGLQRKKELDWRSPIEIDHILEVHQGGSGCWLDNYQPLCYICHNAKGKP